MREYTQTKRPALYVINNESITIYSEPKRHGASDVIEAKKWISKKYDYPYKKIKVATNDQKMHVFITQVFRHESTRKLRWFQIPTMKIRDFAKLHARGITVEDYINKYVLPKVKETELEHLSKYGESIYSI